MIGSIEDNEIVIDLKYGYRHWKVLPTQEELDNYYCNSYYETTSDPGMNKSMDKDRAEIDWLNHTLYNDIEYIISGNIKRNTDPTVLEIGCGSGNLIAFLSGKNYYVEGVEPSSSAREIALSKGLRTKKTPFLETRPTTYDVIIAINVLEHILDPVDFLVSCKPYLDRKGILIIRVPNDFSSIQQLAYYKTKKSKPWWLSYPDHINYFSKESLENLLVGSGFEVVYGQSDFPMESYLIAGRDYIDEPEVGCNCHQDRMAFEYCIDEYGRRKLYRQLYRQGIGRNLLVAARKI